MRVAAVQMCSTASVTENRAKAQALLLEAKARGAKLVAFPENFTLMAASPRAYIESAEGLTGPTLSWLKAEAKKHRLWILAGSLPIKAKGTKKVFNGSFLISDKGKVAARYDKVHLFDAVVTGDRAYRESSLNLAGRKIGLAKTPIGAMGLSICYDMRFPELYRLQSQKAPDLVSIFIPAAFTKTTGLAHWDVLTRARAIENQTYVIAPAQYGVHADGRETFGHTRIVDPWGKVLAEVTKGEGLAIADLDPKRLTEIRGNLPALKNRKLKLSAKFST